MTLLNHKKTWVLTYDSNTTFNESDIRWLKGTACNVTIKQHGTQSVQASDGTMLTFCTRPPEIIVETTSVKQEFMLKFKFDNRLILQSIIYEPESPFR